MNVKTFSWLDKISDGLEKLIQFILVISVGGMALDLMLGVVFRYFFQLPIVGTDELALFLLVWVTFLGASLSIKKNEMIAMTFIQDKWTSFKAVFLLSVQLLIISFNLLFLIYGTTWLFSSSTMNIKSSNLQIPVWMVYTVFPFSMFTTVIFSLQNIIRLFASGETDKR